jgi:hypothetical protein
MGRQVRKQKLWDVYVTVSGGKYVGQVSAATKEEAEEKGLNHDNADVCLCHHCSQECEDPHVTEVVVELALDGGGQ